MKNREGIRLGLIGVGRWGKRYIETIDSRPEVYLSIVASKNPETAQLLPNTTIVADWKDLLNKDLDGVIISTPPASHGSILRVFVEAGVPVMVEKPLCLNISEAFELYELIEKKGVPVLVDHTQLFHPAFDVLKKRAKELGNIKFISSEGMAFGPFRHDVSVLWDWAPHDISLCLDLLEELPNRVSALGNEYAVAINLDFDEGFFAWITNSNLSNKKRRMFAVYFEHKVLVLDDLSENKLVECDFNFELRFEKRQVLGSGTPLSVAEAKPLTRAVTHFIQGITGGDLTRFGLRLACDVIRVISTAEKSMEKVQSQLLI